jgi:hypothetical protein
MLVNYLPKNVTFFSLNKKLKLKMHSVNLFWAIMGYTIDFEKGGLDTEFPICHTTAYFGPVYYNDCSALPRHITSDPNNQFW